MPAETLLNAATACSYLSSHKSALQYADSAERSSQVALSAIHHLMGLESPGTHSMRELERMRKAQLDINIMAAIAKANPLERLGHFKQAFEALDRGERMVAEQYGKAHPMMSEFTQLREEIKEQQEFSRGSHWKEGDGDFEGIDMRSEIMKKGRIKRVYYEVQENIINEDKRAQMSSIEAESTNMTQKSHTCHNSCGCHRGGGQDSVTQLMQTRMMQDEQFRMMELMIETQQPEVRHHHHVIQRQRESSPSSSSSDDVVPSETSSSATQQDQDSSDAEHPSTSESDSCSMEDEFEDQVWTKEVKATSVEIDPRPIEFEASAEVRLEKVRQAGLDFFFFDECEYNINPPKRPVDLRRWVHSRMLRWRWVRWRAWKLKYRAYIMIQKYEPYIAAWFFKRFDNGRVAEVKVYTRRYTHTVTTTTKQFKDTQTLEKGADRDKLLDEKHEEGPEHKEVEKERNWGYQISVRDVTSRGKGEWCPLMLAYQDMHAELRHGIWAHKDKLLNEDLDQKEKRHIKKKINDAEKYKTVWNEISKQFVTSKIVVVMVKDHLVIDYIYSAIEIIPSTKGDIRVEFKKLSPQNSLRISFRYYTYKFWYKFGKKKRADLQMLDQGPSESSLTEHEEEDQDVPYIPEEQARMDHAWYNEIQTKFRQLREKGVDVDTMRLKIQNQARQIMQKKEGKERHIKYIVDKTKRGKDEVKHIQIRDKLEPISGILNKDVASFRIVRAARIFLSCIAMKKIWLFLLSLDVQKDNTVYTVQFWRRRRLIDGANNCKIRVVEKYQPDNVVFLKYTPELPIEQKLLDQIRPNQIKLMTNMMGKITDVQFIVNNEPVEERFLFVEYRMPSDSMTGTFEVCRQMLTAEAGVRFCVRLNIVERRDFIFESFLIDSNGHLKSSDRFLVVKEIPVSIRYMRYFMRDHIDINFRGDEFGDVKIKEWDNQLENRFFHEFMAQMRIEENAYNRLRSQNRQVDKREKFLDHIDPSSVLYEWSFDKNPAYLRNDFNQYNRFLDYNLPDGTKTQLKLMRIVRDGDSMASQKGKMGPYMIKVIKEESKSNIQPISILLIDTDQNFERKMEYLTINNTAGIDLKDQVQIKKFVEDNVGFYADTKSLTIHYLSGFGLKVEKLPDDIVEEPNLALDGLIAQAQAIWRGNYTRTEIEKDKKNLFLRFWKTCENSIARVSVRRLKMKHTVTERNQEIKDIVRQEISGEGGQVLNQQKQEEFGQEKINTTTDRIFAFRVEVDNWFVDEKGDAQVKQFQSNQPKVIFLDPAQKPGEYVKEHEMPDRRIALEWFRQAVYIHWSPLEIQQEVKLKKNVKKYHVDHKGLLLNEHDHFETISKSLNQYKVEGFSVHKPENFYVDFIWQKRNELLQRLRIKEFDVLIKEAKQQWWGKHCIKVDASDDGKKKYFLVLSQADPSSLSSAFMKVDVYFHDGLTSIATSKFGEEANMILGNHKLKLAGSKTYSLDECIKYMWPRDKRMYSTSTTLLDRIERVCFSKNVTAWQAFLAAHAIRNNSLDFNLLAFENTRWGVNIASSQHNARLIGAAKTIVKWLRRNVVRKRCLVELRKEGFKYLSGVLRMLGLTLVYVLAASDDNTRFAITLTERSLKAQPITIVERCFINYDQLEVAVRKQREQNQTYLLQAVAVVLEDFLRSHSSKLSRDHDDSPTYAANWRETLTKLMIDEFCTSEKQYPKAFVNGGPSVLDKITIEKKKFTSTTVTKQTINKEVTQTTVKKTEKQAKGKK